MDFIVSGHTHGGEIRLPGILGLGGNGIPLFPLPTELGAQYDEGDFDYRFDSGETIPLYITSGVGQSGTDARLFNPPEIIIFGFK